MTERKIAVVLIHGIGDQKPMATLRSFVEAVLVDRKNEAGRPLYWSKPDTLSGSFELRRLNASPGHRRPPIDFYEYYWAHRMQGNAVVHAVQWLNDLMLRRPSTVPAILRRLWWLCWAGLLAVAGLAAWLATWTPVGGLAFVVGLIVAAAKLVTDTALRDWIGDAARYFNPRPHNVGVREAIRRGGVELLEKLHASGEYKRIIVVGHSLGSAIAMDILYHYWVGARERHGSPEMPVQTAREAFEAMLKAAAETGKPPPVGTVRGLQKPMLKELHANGVPWRISDLITLGSPLAHLPFLVGLDAAGFADRLQQREMPMCPPVLDGKGIAYWRRYVSANGQPRSIGTLHHAACFAATRWTNIYFPHDGWFGGDPVGGPLRGLFGWGIDDRVVRTQHRGGRINHVDYWQADMRDTDDATAPLKVLQSALNLDEGFRN